MRKPSQITQREIDLAAQTHRGTSMASWPSCNRRGSIGAIRAGLPAEYATLAVVPCSPSRACSACALRHVRFVGNDCNPAFRCANETRQQNPACRV